MLVKEITVVAILENLDTVIDLINAELEENDCPVKTQMQIAISVEEIYVNIAHYAYQHTEQGNVIIQYEVGGDPIHITIQFVDSGLPYNPLEKEDPDVSLSAEERDIGGLGIYMVKKLMDNLAHQYKDGKNILTIQKNL